MFYHAKGGNVRVGNSDMDYISFGSGSKILVMLPGLGDGLSTVKGKALVLAMAYHMYAQKYTVYVFSRKITCRRDILQGKWQKIRRRQ